ncbi:hypothetical protein CMI45_01195 [Candidatus Pacearchaeota archaeon]|nr:hypothetical protein [Candidatus Pacearchaeota archaeon]|tara:strand:+ start:2896 stop:3528 length:633 start_codon:yes stop_codon:yes gene_type:complete
MKINRCKKKLENIPVIIASNGKTIQDVELGLFSNFFIIGIDDIFFQYPDCDILILKDVDFIKKHSNIIKNLRCLKCCPNHRQEDLNCFNLHLVESKKHKKRYDFNFYDNECVQDVAIQLASFLGCNPIIVAGFDSKDPVKLRRKKKIKNSLFNVMNDNCDKCMKNHSKWLKNIIYSITPSGHIPYIDPFVAHSKYNDQCPDKLDLLKRIV